MDCRRAFLFCKVSACTSRLATRPLFYRSVRVSERQGRASVRKARCSWASTERETSLCITRCLTRQRTCLLMTSSTQWKLHTQAPRKKLVSRERVLLRTSCKSRHASWWSQQTESCVLVLIQVAVRMRFAKSLRISGNAFTISRGLPSGMRLPPWCQDNVLSFG